MNRPLIVGIAGALVVLAAILLTFFIDREPDEPLARTSNGDEPISVLPKESLPVDMVSRKPTSLESASAGRASDGSDDKRGIVNLPSVKPSFDIVRVNPQGNAVIAGRAAPNSLITVRRGNKVVGTVKADKRGEWVLLPENALSGGAHELTVMATDPDGTEAFAEQSVVVVVPQRGGATTGKTAPKTTGSVVVAIPNSEGEAPFLLSKPIQTSRLRLTLDVIDYGRRHDAVSLSGRAAPGAEVRIYLDNKYIGRTRADEQGTWRRNLSVDIPAGLYRLRVDRVGSYGKTVERVELPFLRAIPVGDIPDNEVAFVQPGNSLWRLARKAYGSGLRYTEIYEANKDQIRDPDLIYPGQVFLLPRSN